MNEKKVKNVTLCTIVADSEDCLPRFFSWCLPIFKNIVIVTSESKDNTIQVIQKVKEENPYIILEHREMDDFAKQKQYSLDLASTEWKIIIDADEILEDLDLDSYVEKLTESSIDLVYFPRFNLQVDESHYLESGYPDFQARLLNSKVSYNPDTPVHEQLIGAGTPASSEKHIIHWGHIRPKAQLQRKSDVRKKFAYCDLADGEGLLKYSNWFYERNDTWNRQARLLPPKIIKRIKEYENRDSDGVR